MTDRAELIERICSGNGEDQELNAEIWEHLEPKKYSAAVWTGQAVVPRNEKKRAGKAHAQYCAPNYLTSHDAIAAIPGANIVGSWLQDGQWYGNQLGVEKQFVCRSDDRPRAELAAVLSDPDVGGE